jgi:hypothetical protein
MRILKYCPHARTYMIVVLGAVDLICAGALAFLAFGTPLYPLQAGAALLLLLKAAFYIGDMLSIVDVVAGLLMLGLIWFEAPILALVLALYLGGKALYSFT